jgi:hypothetical protein
MIAIPELLGRGLCVTRAQVRRDFSEVVVFWVAGPGREEEVRDLLERHARQIR